MTSNLICQYDVDTVCTYKKSHFGLTVDSEDWLLAVVEVLQMWYQGLRDWMTKLGAKNLTGSGHFAGPRPWILTNKDATSYKLCTNILQIYVIANNYVKLMSTIKRILYNDLNHSNEMWRHSALESRLVTSWLWLVDRMEKSPRHWVLFHRPAKMGTTRRHWEHWMHLNAKCDTTWFDPKRVYPLNGLFMVGVLETSISLQYACFKNGSPISNTLQCIMMSYDVLCLFLQIWL